MSLFPSFFVRKLLQALELLRLRIEQLTHAINGHAESLARYQRSEAHQRQHEPQAEVKSVVRLPVEVTEYYRSEQGERRVKGRKEKIRLLMEALGLVFALSLAVLTLCTLKVFNGQLAEMKKQTKSAQQFFRTGNRPYIWASPHGAREMSTGIEHVLTPGSRLANDIGQPKKGRIFVTVNVTIRNSGRSPAVDVVNTRSFFEVGPAHEALKRAKSFVPHFAKDAAGTVIREGGSLMVGTPRLPSLTKAQAELVKRSVWGIYIVGAVRYRDIFSPRLRIPYETIYCFHYNLLGEPFGGCGFGTSIK